METKYIDVDGDWGIVIVIDYDVDYDYRDLRAIMMSFGLTDKRVEKAMNILCEPNTGMAVSNNDLRMSVVFICNATSESEWWSTAVHELKHVADAIIKYYGVRHDGEDAAYLTGYLTKELIGQVGLPCYD